MSRTLTVFALASCLLSLPAVLGATPFVLETVDAPSTIAGNNVSLAIDAAGNPHIAYHDASAADLKYAKKVGGTWIIETVDGFTTNVGSYCSLALDAQGIPRIAYYDATNGDLRYASKVTGTWVTEAVDNVNNVGQWCSLALDAQGNPKIAYQDVTNFDLKFATRLSGGSWFLEVVDTPNNLGMYASLALDAQGNPRIAYLDQTNGDLRYASKAGNLWQPIEVVDATNAGYYASIALDPAGNPRIAYYDGVASDLKFATKTGLSWGVEVVESVFSSGLGASLAIDAAGIPRISYYDATSQDLKMATKAGSWTIETVDLIGTVGFPTSIALDSQGNPRIAYLDGTSSDLEYADSSIRLVSPMGGERWGAGTTQTVRWTGVGPVSILLSEDGGFSYTTLLSAVTSNAVTITVPNVTTESARFRVSRSSPASSSDSPGYLQIAPGLVSPWWTQFVDQNPGSVGQFTSIKLDSQNNPRVAYHDGTNSDLKYASRTGNTWTTETVDAPGNVGLFVSLALDSQGLPHVSYRDNTNQDLKYARKTAGGTWVIEVVDAPGDVGSWSSLALDSQDNPQISYYDVTNVHLKYAAKSAGVWSTLTLDSSPLVGMGTSLALDALGNPRIAYQDQLNGDLKFVYKLNGGWIIETADASPNIAVGSPISLALDSQGNASVAYWDSFNQDLRFATRAASAGTAAIWTTELVDATGNQGSELSLALDAKGNPCVAYYDGTPNFRLKLARKLGGTWNLEVVDAQWNVGIAPSIAIDSYGNPHITYRDIDNTDLKYVSAAISLGDPMPGVTWPVGSVRNVTWKGTGPVDLYLSSDGGNSWELQASRLTGGLYRMPVPHTPSKFTQLKLERAVPRSASATGGLFTIETDIALLNLKAQPGGGGVLLSWNTNPGPEDLGGYRVEKRFHSDDWQSVTAFTRETSLTDPNGAPGTEYRLFGINGLGQELLLGQTLFGRLTPLQAGPLPFRGGNMQISFASDGGSLETEVALFDLQGRKVRSLANGLYPVGIQTVSWDGRTDGGQLAASGAYFLRLSDGGRTVALNKIIVAR